MVVLLLVRWPESKLPHWVTFLVPLAGGVANVCVLLAIPATGWPENEAWSLGLTGMLCWGLVVRERILAAWVGVALLTGGAALWVIVNGLPPALILTMSLGHILSLTVWTLITTLARWASVSIFRDQERQMELEAKRIEDLQTNQVIESTLSRVEKKVRPLLETIASDAPLTNRERSQAALIEAELRDEIRGGNHLVELLAEEVKRARERGVVLLMNDRGESAPPPELLTALRVHMTQALGEVDEGQVVIRLVPARTDHRVFATYSSPGRSFNIYEDGSVVEL